MGGRPKAAAPGAPVAQRPVELKEMERKTRRDMQRMQGFQSTLFAGAPNGTGGSALLGGGN